MDSCAIPVGIVFKALGIIDNIDIATHIFDRDWFTKPPSHQHRAAIEILIKSLEQSWNITTREDALNYIGKHGKKYNKKKQKPEEEWDIDIQQHLTKDVNSYAQYLLDVEFFPHIGPNLHKEKSVYLGCMVRRLLLAEVGILPVSDRDHAANRRIHTSGMLLSAQFYVAFKQLASKIIKLIEIDVKKNVPVNIATYIKTPHIITGSLTSAISSDKWSNSAVAQGISQMLDDFNIVSVISFLRKFSIFMQLDDDLLKIITHNKSHITNINSVSV